MLLIVPYRTSSSLIKHFASSSRRKFSRDAVLINGLGISEAAGNVCFFTCRADIRWEGSSVPIGHAVEGVELLILDEDGRAQPAGREGEIAVRCDHLADGYWRQPGESQQRFRPIGADATPAYRTGDLGVLLEDGCALHRGRKDEQVKIRGHRVELTEIEAVILSLEGVRECAVIAREYPDGPKLAAFVVPSTDPTIDAWRKALRSRLPSHMVPNFIVAVPALPQLSGGKVDRKGLQKLDIPAAARSERVAPRTELESQLQQIWKQALGVEDVGVTDDFHELGGDSMGAVRIFALVDKLLGVNLPLISIIDHPTIEKLAAAIAERDPQSTWSTAVLLRAGSGAVSLFCLPGAGSDVLVLQDLARHIGGEFNVYGLRHHGLAGEPLARWSVEEKAARMLAALRRIQPAGPYYLAGTSFGGVVAFELARQLMEQGERIGCLALLDTYGPGYPRIRSRLRLRTRLLLLLRWWLPLTNKNELTWKNFARGCRERLIRIRAHVELALPFRRVTPTYAHRFIYLMTVSMRARARYSFRPLGIKAELFRAGDELPASLYEPSRDLGWTRVLGTGLAIHHIPGNHFTYMIEPNVKVLAYRLTASLRASLTAGYRNPPHAEAKLNS